MTYEVRAVDGQVVIEHRSEDGTFACLRLDAWDSTELVAKLLLAGQDAVGGFGESNPAAVAARKKRGGTRDEHGQWTYREVTPLKWTQNPGFRYYEAYVGEDSYRIFRPGPRCCELWFWDGPCLACGGMPADMRSTDNAHKLSRYVSVSNAKAAAERPKVC